MLPIDGSTPEQKGRDSGLPGMRQLWLYIALLLGASLIIVGYFAYGSQVEINQWQNTVFELADENEALQIQITQLQMDKHETEVNLSQLQLERENLQNQIQAQQIAIADFEQQWQDTQNALATIEAENNRLKVRLAEMGLSQNKVDTLEAENRRLQMQLVASQGEFQGILGQEQARLLLVSGADRIATIPGTSLAPNATATFYTDAAQQAGLLLVKHLPAPAVGETYQLWLIPAASDPIAAGEVTVLANQPAWTMITIPEAAQGFEFIGVSRESTGWQPEQGPTADMIVLLGSGVN